MYRVRINGEIKEYKEGVSFLDIAKEYAGDFEHEIVLARADKKLKELAVPLKRDCELSFVTTADKSGIETYNRSLLFMCLKAIYDELGQERLKELIVHFSIGKGLYIEAAGDFKVDSRLAAKIKKRMEDMVSADLPIRKRVLPTDDAIEIFAKHRMADKERLLKYRRASYINIYSIDDFDDYFYGYMLPSTGYLKYFDIHRYEKGLVLMLPDKNKPEEVPEFVPSKKIFNALIDATRWSVDMDIHTVGALNDNIANGHLKEIILVQEALMEKRIGDIAHQISKSGRKIVLIAGPSSSGKTTFSRRLSIQLKTFGLNPYPISVDDYFVDRDFTPKDAQGNYDFEALECVDIEKFNDDMLKLLEGERIELPVYNFKQGKREYKGNYLKMDKDDILVIEGIHSLNDKMSYRLPDDSRFKIYISALTQLNVDEHNRIPTTDGRLIRRMIRDARTRGTDARGTIAMWPSVVRGEEKNIFPYQETADVVFNSAMIYELAVLKSFAEPLLFGIGKDCPACLNSLIISLPWILKTYREIRFSGNLSAAAVLRFSTYMLVFFQ